MTGKTKALAAEGLKMLVDARSILDKVAKSIDQEIAKAAPGSRIEQIGQHLTRMHNHLSDAIADVPTEFWCAMVRDNGISLDDLRKNLNAA
jgi:hypothetical protein